MSCLHFKTSLKAWKASHSFNDSKRRRMKLYRVCQKECLQNVIFNLSSSNWSDFKYLIINLYYIIYERFTSIFCFFFSENKIIFQKHINFLLLLLFDWCQNIYLYLFTSKYLCFSLVFRMIFLLIYLKSLYCPFAVLI